MPEPIFIKLCVYIMATEPISTAYFISPSHQSVCLYAYSSDFATQRVDKHIPATKNTRNNRTILDESSTMQYAFYQRRVCGSVYVTC
jgi:hypothetical protein